VNTSLVQPSVQPSVIQQADSTSSLNTHSHAAVRSELHDVSERLNTLILGKSKQIKLSLTCLLANGHLLIDDLPGMGKTVLSNSLASVLGLDYKRVQFTNDLLPADILGASIYEKETSSFRFIPGPVFSQLLLADEINRASPKTQSALLEAMEERQVSLEGETRSLPAPFFVIATQNPLEQIGTSALPESQLDRFMMRIQMGYPSRSAEMGILSGQSRRLLIENQKPIITTAQLIGFQRAVNDVVCSEHALSYLYELLLFTRQSGLFINGISTRGGLAILHAAKAWAWLSCSDVLMPKHIQAVLPSVAGNSLQSRDCGTGSQSMGEHILEQVAIPR